MVTQLIAEAIEWCNTNEGFASIAISTVSVITAIVALCISNSIAKKQNRISLFEKRLECYQKLMILKEFSDFANNFDSFDLQPGLNPRIRCQQEYLNIHGVFDSEKRTQLSQIGNMGGKYAMDCLNKDIELFTTIQMLFGLNGNTPLLGVKSALKAFVEAFVTLSDPKGVKSAQKNLFKAFADAEEYCNSLRYEVKMHHTLRDYFEKLRGKKHDKS